MRPKNAFKVSKFELPANFQVDFITRNSSGQPRTLVSVNAKKKQKAAAAAAAAANAAATAASAVAGNSNSVSNGREVVVDEKAKEDLKS